MKKIVASTIVIFTVLQAVLAQKTIDNQIIAPPTEFNPAAWDWNTILIVTTIGLLAGIIFRVLKIQQIIKKAI